MNKENIVLGALAAVIVLSTIFAKVPNVVVNTPAPVSLGAQSGQIQTTRQDFLVGATVASLRDADDSVPTVSAAATTTLTSAQVCNNNVVNVAFNINNGVVTFPTAAALIQGECFTQGTAKSFVVRNASTTITGATVGFTVGASSTIFSYPSSTVTGIVNGSTTIPVGAVLRVTANLITSTTPWVLYEATPERSQ